MKTKICSKCGLEQPVKNFTKQKLNTCGLASWCNGCKSSQLRESRHRRGISHPMEETLTCSQYLGIHIAESIASKIYGKATRAKPNTRGYDLTCSNGYKIDVKSSVLHNWNGYFVWHFMIHCNKVPSFFLCLAFDDRTSYKICKAWLIPSNIINDKKSIGIAPSSHKYDEYEIDLSQYSF